MTHSNWEDLRFILAVAETGSVNAAGKLLNVNHATVLRRLAAFETRTGTRLFLKSAKGYQLDPAFEPALAVLKEMESKVHAFGRATLNPAMQVSGDVYVTSTDTLCELVLPDVIRFISATYPSIRFNLAVSNSHLDMARLDAEITFRPAQKLSEDLIGTEVGTLTFDVYATRPYAAEFAGKAVGEYRWIAPDGPLLSAPISDWKNLVDASTIVATASSFLTMARLAETGMGATLLPNFVGADFPNLIQIPVNIPTQQTKLWVACHRDIAGNPRVAKVMEAMIGRLKEWDARQAPVKT